MRERIQPVYAQNIGKINKEPFLTCVECFRVERDKPSKGKVTESSAITNFIESMSSYDRDRAESDPY